MTGVGDRCPTWGQARNGECADDSHLAHNLSGEVAILEHVEAQTERALNAIRDERRRQTDDKGWTREHDDEHGWGHLVDLARARIDHLGTTRHELVEASALLVAALEVIEREEAGT